MKRITALIISILFVTASFAQEKKDTTYWTNGGMFSVNFTQLSFTNWAAGGLNSVAGVAKAQYFANYKKANTTWDNILDLGYGLSKVEEIPIQKNEDIIDLQSKLGILAVNKWYYSGLLNFKSQFAPGYKDKNNTEVISNFFAPAYLFVSIGMDYKPNDKFSLMISPVTGKVTFVSVESLRTNYCVDADKMMRPEFGAYIKSALNTEIVKNIGLLTEIGLFTNYLKNPEKIDVDWKLAINMKVNKYISAQLGTHLIYDYDIKDPADGVAKIQFKELFGIGFSYKF